MPTFDASSSEVYFDGVTDLADVAIAAAGTYSWLTADPVHVITASGTGFTYGGPTFETPTGGTVDSIAFDWVDEDHPAGVVDAVIVGLSVALTAMGQTHFWETVLDGSTAIVASKLAGGRFFGDFQHVVTDGFNSILREGSDDTFTAAAETAGGLLFSRGDGVAANALIGDAQLVQGEDVGGIALFADVTGGDDIFNISGLPLYFAVGDVQSVGFLGGVIGGDDVINSSVKYVGVLTFGRMAQYAGDVEASMGRVTGGDDTITGSNFAFAPEFIVGDVSRNLDNGFLTGGIDTLLGRGGQDMVAGDAGTIGSESRTHGGADLIRGGGDSDILAGDVLLFDLNTSGQVRADVVGGDDRIIGDIGDDWISGDVWEISNANGFSNIIGGADRLFGGDGDDQIFGDAGTSSSGLVTADFLIGGDDLIDGGLGNDLLNGQGGSDTVSFAAIAAAVTVNLQNGVATGQGTDELASIENAVGSSKADVILGDTGANTLSGGAGRDEIDGRAGADAVTGGEGADDLSGGGGKDVFDYNSLTESGITANTRDVILDWDAADLLDVSAIDADGTKNGNQIFVFDGSAAPGRGEIGLQAVAGGIVVLFNTDNDANMEMTIEVVTNLAMTAGDFVL